LGLNMSVQEFLESLSSKGTKKVYKMGLKKFFEWYGKTADQVLQERKEDLTQRPNDDLVTYKNRAANYSKIIERFHAYLLDEGYKINTAKSLTNGIRQLFRYNQMDIKVRNGSNLNKTVKTQRNFPLTIEHIRKMYAVANFRERVILSMATDLGLRVSDFLKIKKQDLPDLTLEAPISFDVMTEKEDVIARGFLSQETVELLKKYIKTLPDDNPYLFPSSQNKSKPISRTQIGNLLKDLAKKAGLRIGNGKSLTFHCFRKMLLSAAIDSGIGLTAGKKLVGKTIPQSDDTYLTTVKLREKFNQLKKFLTITRTIKSETQQLDKLSSLVAKLSEELEQQKTITKAVTGENLNMRKEFKKQVAELKEELAVTRFLGEQVTKIGEAVKKWQSEKGEIEAKIGGILNFQKLVLEQSDEEILEFIKDVRRQLKEQQSGK
jgi:integrase